MKNGFTLVELSIVLVIIGLLTGGILVGQSLIENVQTKKSIKFLTEFQIAVDQFKSKYRLYPGDSPSFSPAGNGNGFFDGSESAYFLDQLVASEMKNLSSSYKVNLTSKEVSSNFFKAYMQVNNSWGSGYPGNSIVFVASNYYSIDEKIDDSFATTGKIFADGFEERGWYCQIGTKKYDTSSDEGELVVMFDGATLNDGRLCYNDPS